MAGIGRLGGDEALGLRCRRRVVPELRRPDDGAVVVDEDEAVLLAGDLDSPAIGDGESR